jgi:hypothetical protein
MKQPVSTVIKRRIRIAKELRDQTDDWDLRTYDYFNGMATTLSDLLAELCGKRFDKRFGEKDAS